MIVESPGKTKTIRGILGDGWQVSASVGHIRDLPERSIGVEPPDFKPSYVPTERGKEILARLKKQVAVADAVFLATDLDREGEAIAWHLSQSLKIKNPQRIVFNEITPKGVNTALASPRGINIPMVAAQEARRVCDRVVGYMVSPKLSELSGRQGLSAGRVQSPAVRIIVEREREIRTFKPTTYFGVELGFDGNWTAEWDVKPFLASGSEYLMDSDLAGKVAKLRNMAVISCDNKETSKAPPPPFITSTLQQAASNKLGMKPKATMAAAQKLYEQGHITYMRTDNPNLSDDALAEIYTICQAKGLPMVDRPRTWKAKDGAQEAHEAIRPSHFEVETAGETEDEKALYKLIWDRAVACQLAAARYAVRVARLKALDVVNGKAVEFLAEGRTQTFSGWTALFADYTEEYDSKKKGDTPNNPVPMLEPSQTISAIEGRVLTKKTRAPSRYTQAALVAELERLGIGRPSTYAAIMDTISKRGYVEHDKAGKYLVPTELGETVLEALVKGNFSFIEYAFTRDLEEELDLVAQSRVTYKNVVAKVYDALESELAGLKINIAPQHLCPECGKALARRRGKNGYFWGCTGYPDCSTRFPDSAGKPGKPKPPQQTASEPCPKCGSPIVRRHKPGKTGYDFWGCSGYPKCNAKFNNAGGKPDFMG